MGPGGDTQAARSADYACPSAPAEPGAGLLGLLGPDGRIANLRLLMQVDEDFLQAARAKGAPEARMRFTSPCQTKGCSQWTGHSCGVIERVMNSMAEQGLASPQALQPCTIRATCRWYDQAGPEACAACALVITDTREPA
jgi:hypothetical protein